jgi:hypothetical protein
MDSRTSRVTPAPPPLSFGVYGTVSGYIYSAKDDWLHRPAVCISRHVRAYLEEGRWLRAMGGVAWSYLELKTSKKSLCTETRRRMGTWDEEGGDERGCVH